MPDWSLWVTAGSFFKNPVVTTDKFAELQKKYPGLPGFPEPVPVGITSAETHENGMVKVSLGWILDKVCNVKGICRGKACVYEKQALVLVTEPGATAEEVFGLARELMSLVKEKTGIEIEGEVEWVN